MGSPLHYYSLQGKHPLPHPISRFEWETDHLGWLTINRYAQPQLLAEKTGKDKILGAYYNSQWIIEKATNVTAASCPTLRDFLNKVLSKLPIKTADQFAELTKMAEVAMYSISEQDERSVFRAYQLADEIIKELHTTSMEPQ